MLMKKEEYDRMMHRLHRQVGQWKRDHKKDELPNCEKEVVEK